MTIIEALEKTIVDLDGISVTGYTNCRKIAESIERLSGIKDALAEVQNAKQEEQKGEDLNEGNDNETGKDA